MHFEISKLKRKSLKRVILRRQKLQLYGRKKNQKQSHSKLQGFATLLFRPWDGISVQPLNNCLERGKFHHGICKTRPKFMVQHYPLVIYGGSLRRKGQWLRDFDAQTYMESVRRSQRGTRPL